MSIVLLFQGETKECTEFAKQFLERRSKYKNQQRAANAHIDDMCSPAPAITPSSDFQEVKVSKLDILMLKVHSHNFFVNDFETLNKNENNTNGAKWKIRLSCRGCENLDNFLFLTKIL